MRYYLIPNREDEEINNFPRIIIAVPLEFEHAYSDVGVQHISNYTKSFFVQSAGAVEYTDCISAEG